MTMSLLMKLAAAAFLLLLLGAHGEGDLPQRLRLPLSQFRDFGPAWIGYGLFALLVAVGTLYALALWRTPDREAEATIASSAAGLLVLVAATPSVSGPHHLCAFLLMGVLFVYFGVLLLKSSTGPWLALHLAAPLVLACATQLHSYGMWQKSFIVYCVLAIALHEHLLARAASGVQRRRRRGDLPLPGKKRKVWVLNDEGQAWSRRPALGSS